MPKLVTFLCFGAGPNQASDGGDEIENDPQMKELFLPLRVLCTRKDVRFTFSRKDLLIVVLLVGDLPLFVSQIQRHEVVLDDADVTKALIDFVKQNAIDMLVLGATNKGSIFRCISSSNVTLQKWQNQKSNLTKL